MKKLLLFFFTLSLLQLQSQTWCPPGAIWYYRDYNEQHSTYKDGTLELYFTNTVTVNNIVCKEIKGTFYGKVSYFYPPQTITDYVTYRTYEANHVVYIFNVSTQVFDTIANFNAHPGDSWFYAMYTAGCGNLGIARSKVTVYDTGHVVINGFSLKKLVMSPLTATAQAVFIERIGGMPGFLFDQQDCNLDGATMGNFSCYQDNSFPVYKQAGVTNCNYNTVAIKENALSNAYIKLYPNPNNGHFKLDLPKPAGVTIYNGLGALVYENAFENAGDFEIQIPGLPQGLYYIKIKTGPENGYSKFIKE